MNGGVNGMMEESMKLSPTDSSENSLNDNVPPVDSPKVNKINYNNQETNDLAGDDKESDDKANITNENTNNNGAVDHETDLPETSTVPIQDHINNVPNDHSSHSNEDYPTLTNSQVEPESNQEIPIVSKVSEIKEEANEELNEESNDVNTKGNISKNVHEPIDSINGMSEQSESSDEYSQEEGNSEVSGPQKAETVSINSDSDMDAQDDSSQENQKTDKNNVNPLLTEWSDDRNCNFVNCGSPDIQEIVSDSEDCVIEEVPKLVEATKVPLRRSSRAIKRKRYVDDLENGDEGSDIEEIATTDYRSRPKAIVINDTKTLVEMAAKQMRSGIHKKDPTVVILDTNGESSGKGGHFRKSSVLSNHSQINAQNLYQSILARGTTVTPLSSKNTTSSSSQSCFTSQQSILPSLTDDMFVVEAPSFIVPYVYEKPSLKPFREFVDKLGSEIAAQKIKEEEEKREKDKAEKAKRDEEKKEKKERGEEVEESEEEIEKPDVNLVETEKENDEEKRKKKEEKKERRRRRLDDDDASWDGESSSDSDDEIGSDEEEAVVIKEKADPYEEIKDITGLTVEKVVTGKSDNYFDMSLGKFFMDIGLNLVQEFVQNDLLKQQNRKLYREKKGGHSTKATETSITSLMKNLEFSKKNNAPYKFGQHKCEFCSFKSESLLALSHHLETPHMKNNVYKCNFCVYESKSPHDILYHMEAEHNTRGRLERAPAYHQCANCPFEDNGKGKLARHLIPCAKKFKPEFNLAPPIEWEPPAKIPKMARARNTMMGTYQNTFHRGQVGNNLGRTHMNNFGTVSSFPRNMGPRGRSPMVMSPRSTPIQGIPIIRGGVIARHNTPTPVPIPTNLTVNNEKNSTPKSTYQPSISITPLPRHPQPVQPPLPQQNKSTCVICEICDGYIKDLEQLRNHMQWIHKVKIHPKMIYNRPPLNCQKCQFRFFTDQGLERHLLGSHGLVTSSMQEAANKGKDAGRCPVCGRVYQWKLLNHVTRDHKLTLKPAHLSYKCTVCTATFGMYKQFENHVYSAHSVVAKRVMDKGKTPTPTKTGQSLLKPLKINDEITIIPQPVKANTPPIKEK